jgi:hypothetical protein
MKIFKFIFMWLFFRKYILICLLPCGNRHILKVSFFLLPLLGCGNAGTVTVANVEDVVYQIDVKDCLDHASQKKVSDLTDSLRYVELKTPRSLPIGVVTNIVISDEYIFVASKRDVYQFNLQGDYVRQIGHRGKGPGEYLTVTDILIDENRKRIDIFSVNTQYSYSFDGKFFGQRSIGFFSNIMVEDSLLYASSVPFGQEKYKMVILNTALDTIVGIPNDNVFDNEGVTMMITLRFRQPFYRYGGYIYFKGYQDNDTIWRVNDTGYTTRAVINMGQYKSPELRNVGNMRMFFDNFNKKKGNYYLVLSAMEDEQFIYLSMEPYWDPEMGSPRLLFDKLQNKGTVLEASAGDYGFIDDIHGGPVFWPQVITKNHYVSVMNAEDFIEKSLSLDDRSLYFRNFIK